MSGESIGAQVRKIRLQKGISLEEAHKNTKIHLDVLKSIEEDNYININPVYLKGFLKIYCQYLGIDLPEPIAEKKHTQVQVMKVEPPREKGAGFSVQGIRKFVPQLVAVMIVTAAAALLVVSGKFVFSRFSAGKHNRRPVIARVRKHSQVKKTTVKAAPKTAAPVVKELNPPEVQSLRLGIRALEDCWLQLKVDNKVVFQNILKKGRVEAWEADDRIDLTLGSAGGVQLEYNGKIISSLGKRGQVLKNISITRQDGLKVGK